MLGDVERDVDCVAAAEEAFDHSQASAGEGTVDQVEALAAIYVEYVPALDTRSLARVWPGLVFRRSHSAPFARWLIVV